MDSIVEDVRHALRALRRSPAFAATAVAMLALAIGANAAVFTLSSAVLFDGFPAVEENERIVYIASERSACCLSYPDFEDWRARATSFDGLAVVHGVTISVSDTSGLPESHEATEVSANTFGLVGQRPVLGRDFSPADERPGAAPVVMLSHTLWVRRYGGDPAIVGRSLRLDGVPTTVIGVMPAGFAFPQKQDLWVPLVPTADSMRRDARDLWFAFGRLADGVTLERARVEMRAIGADLAREYPDANRGYLPAVRNFNEFFVGPNEGSLYLTMWGAVAFVLLIGCVNLANLMLARTTSRSRELSVRMALGARPWRIARQLAIEGLLLAGVGAVLGWWIAKGGVYLYSLAERGPGRSPWRVLDYAMDYEVLAYVAAITIATAVAFGLAPAHRLAKLDVHASLKDGDRGATGGPAGNRLSAALVAAGVALAVVLLSSAGLMMRSYAGISGTDTGIVAANVVTGFVEPPTERYPTAETRAAFYDRLEQRLEALPGVESAGFASDLPTWGARNAAYELPDTASAAGDLRPSAAALVVSPGYFRTLGASVLAGRELEDTDDARGAPVALVNERFASRAWPGDSALGKRLRLADGQNSGAWLTVVGVVSNIMQSDATRQSFDAAVYLPHRQVPRAGLWILARTRTPPMTLANALRGEVQAIDSDLPVMLGPYALEDRMAEVYSSRELYTLLFGIFAAIALTIAAVGLYSIVAYSVSRHTREIGIRMAMGARARAILMLVFRLGMAPLAVGLAIGAIASLGAARLLESMLAHVSPTDPLAFAGAIGVLVAAGALGCWLPARRATRVDPVVVLRR